MVDRRATPSHGYRAVHVIVSMDRHLAEVQVRTELQHRWAMLVERFADAWVQQIKYGGPPDDAAASWASRNSRGGMISLLPTIAQLIDSAEAAEVQVTAVQREFGPLAKLAQAQEQVGLGRRYLTEALQRMAELPL